MIINYLEYFDQNWYKIYVSKLFFIVSGNLTKATVRSSACFEEVNLKRMENSFLW